MYINELDHIRCYMPTLITAIWSTTMCDVRTLYQDGTRQQTLWCNKAM